MSRSSLQGAETQAPRLPMSSQPGGQGPLWGVARVGVEGSKPPPAITVLPPLTSPGVGRALGGPRTLPQAPDSQSPTQPAVRGSPQSGPEMAGVGPLLGHQHLLKAVLPRASLLHRTTLEWCHFRSGLCEGQKALFTLPSRCSGAIGVGPVGRDVSASDWDISGASPSSPHTAHRTVRGRWRPLVSKGNPSTMLDTQGGRSRASSIRLSSTLSPLSKQASRSSRQRKEEKNLFSSILNSEFRAPRPCRAPLLCSLLVGLQTLHHTPTPPPTSNTLGEEPMRGRNGFVGKVGALPEKQN